MDALSSMIKMRLLPSGPMLAMAAFAHGAGKLENERCSAAGSVAGHAQRAAELLRGKRTTVQTEAVSVNASREPVRKHAGHILRRYAHTVVDDAYAHAARRRFDAQSDELVRSAGFV